MTFNQQPQSRPFNAADDALPAKALEGVRTRRMVAFLLDFMCLSLIAGAIVIVLLILGIPTLGISWFFIPAVLGLFPLIALVYNGISISGWRRATPGMRHAGLEMRLTDGARVSFLHAAVHAILYYIGVAFLTPLILLVSLVTTNKRCLHDMLSNTIVTRRQQ